MLIPLFGFHQILFRHLLAYSFPHTDLYSYSNLGYKFRQKSFAHWLFLLQEIFRKIKPGTFILRSLAKLAISNIKDCDKNYLKIARGAKLKQALIFQTPNFAKKKSKTETPKKCDFSAAATTTGDEGWGRPCTWSSPISNFSLPGELSSVFPYVFQLYLHMYLD